MYNENHVIFFSSPRGPFGFLSNFYPSPIIVNGIEYHHVEGFYQSQKHSVDNVKAEEHVRCVTDPGGCKRIARSYRMTDARTQQWNSGLKLEVMKKALLIKFSKGTCFCDLLLDTGSAKLVERAYWDEYWGSGKEGKGENMLGKMLMETREAIRNNTN